MDDESLNKILADVNNRQFWIVLWGYPGRSPNEDRQIFDDPFYDEGLPKNVRDMRIGDTRRLFAKGLSSALSKFCHRQF